MSQLIDIPYSTLKENKRAYEVMLLRDQYDNSFSDIAKEFEISTNRVIQLYHKTKIKQLRLYARHLAIVNGYEDTSAFKYMPLYDCYGDFKYVSAYLEKEYAEILKEYRAREPGHSAEFLAELSPPILEVSDDMTLHVVEFRENEKKTFVEIGRVMKMTKEQARNTYERFYHKKWLAACDKVRETYGNDNFRDYYNDYRTAKNGLKVSCEITLNCFNGHRVNLTRFVYKIYF